jgi:aspartyl/asparaginyl-tRNA synthetase
MIEAEISFIESAVDLMDITEEAIKYCIQYVLSVCEKELRYLGKYFGDADHIDKLCSWLSGPFTRITHAEAVTMMQAEPSGTFLTIPEYDEDLSSEHVDSYDLLVPNVGELVGGSRRIHDLAELESRITELGIDRVPLEFYIALRRDGTVPHGGWGWGHERFVKMLTGAPSVKDCVAFPFYVGCGK